VSLAPRAIEPGEADAVADTSAERTVGRRGDAWPPRRCVRAGAAVKAAGGTDMLRRGGAKGVTERKGLAIAALALGIGGLFTAGGLGIGSLLGVVLAGAALVGVSRGGRDLAWAALAANVFALLTIVPVGAAVVAYRASPAALASDDDELPEPAQNRMSAFAEPPPPPPPPPPARRGLSDHTPSAAKTKPQPPRWSRSRRSASAGRSRSRASSAT
jgi:hypothetical protein